uniref:Putative secreted protein n=1 Tax=Anopheles darlingi TaxID=43151 RepID=A0A2M4DFP7_ANODA
MLLLLLLLLLALRAGLRCPPVRHSSCIIPVPLARCGPQSAAHYPIRSGMHQINHRSRASSGSGSSRQSVPLAPTTITTTTTSDVRSVLHQASSSDERKLCKVRSITS